MLYKPFPAHSLFSIDGDIRPTRHNPEEVRALQNEVDFSFNMGNAHDEWRSDGEEPQDPERRAIEALYGSEMSIIKEDGLPELELRTYEELENLLSQIEEDDGTFRWEEITWSV